MQIEALQLLRNQREQGFEQGSTHEGVEANLAGYRPLRLRLTPDGRVHSLGSFSMDDEAGYWSLITGPSAKKKRFPALRLDPLKRIDEGAGEWELFEKVGRRTFSDSDFSKVVGALQGQLSQGTANVLAFGPAWQKALPLLGLEALKAEESLARVIRLVAAFGAFTGLGKVVGRDPGDQGDGPENQLVDAAAGWLARISDVSDLAAAVHLIVGKRLKKRGRVTGITSVQLCFDIHDPDEPLSTIYTVRTKSRIAACLPKSDRVGTCSLTGSTEPLLADKFPVWTGKVRIYSKNSDAPCNKRYGRADLEAFPVAERVARAVTDGLAQMIGPQREGKTWTFIQNGKGSKNKEKGTWVEHRDWLLAYPSFSADELRTVDIFRAPPDDPRLVRRFEHLAEAVCSLFQARASGLQTVHPYLQVLLIRKVSEGQVQLVFADDTPVSRLVAAVAAWGTNNLPSGFRVPMPSRSGGIGWFKPRIVFPAQVARLLSHQWMRSGTESSRIEGPPIGLVLELFLRKPGVWQGNAAQLLELTLARTSPLLTGLGQLLHLKPQRTDGDWCGEWLKLFPATPAGDPDWKKAQPGRSFVDSISLIGSLLHAMNSSADEYTNESAYLLGRLLAMMDELHRCYCVAVRDGAMPPALIGNGLLGRAAEAPSLAIEELLDRSRVYLGWAKTAELTARSKEQEQIAVFSARKVLRLLGPISEQLHGSDSLNDELSAVRKAHLFLGYLAPVLGSPEEKGEGADDVEAEKETSNEGATQK